MTLRPCILHLLIALTCPAALHAQKTEETIEQEHRYQFALHGEMSLYQEQLLVEQMSMSGPACSWIWTARSTS